MRWSDRLKRVCSIMRGTTDLALRWRELIAAPSVRVALEVRAMSALPRITDVVLAAHPSQYLVVGL